MGQFDNNQANQEHKVYVGNPSQLDGRGHHTNMDVSVNWGDCGRLRGGGGSQNGFWKNKEA